MPLSDRIAALQAKTSSTNSPSSSTVSSPTRSPNATVVATTGSVKDKAAKFDNLGVAPAPRGSFGLGAPLAQAQKPSRELYGNRIPSSSGILSSTARDPSRSPSWSRSPTSNPLQLRTPSRATSPALSAGSSDAGAAAPPAISLTPPTAQTDLISKTDSVNKTASQEHDELPASAATAASAAHTLQTEPDPLTREAVKLLGAATRNSPGGQFHSVAPSEINVGGDDATSSIAVEEDDANSRDDTLEMIVSEQRKVHDQDQAEQHGKVVAELANLETGDEARGNEDSLASPSRSTSSTVSDSALREPPPLLSPSHSVPSFTDSSSSPSIPFGRSNTSGTATTGAKTSLIDEPGVLAGGAAGDDDNSSPIEVHRAVPAGPVLPLSAHLLESLDVKPATRSPIGGAETPKSMYVETGSEDGRATEVEGLTEKLAAVSTTDEVEGEDGGSTPELIAQAIENEPIAGPEIVGLERSSSSIPPSISVDEEDLRSEPDTMKEDADPVVQPSLRISAPVLPLSASHLRALSLEMRSVSETTSGVATPKSTFVEAGSTPDLEEEGSGHGVDASRAATAADGRTVVDEDEDPYFDDSSSQMDIATGLGTQPEYPVAIEMLYTPAVQVVDSDPLLGERKLPDIPPSPSLASPAELAYDKDEVFGKRPSASDLGVVSSLLSAGSAVTNLGDSLPTSPTNGEQTTPVPTTQSLPQVEVTSPPTISQTLEPSTTAPPPEASSDKSASIDKTEQDDFPLPEFSLSTQDNEHELLFSRSQTVASDDPSEIRASSPSRAKGQYVHEDPDSPILPPDSSTSISTANVPDINTASQDRGSVKVSQRYLVIPNSETMPQNSGHISSLAPKTQVGGRIGSRPVSTGSPLLMHTSKLLSGSPSGPSSHSSMDFPSLSALKVPSPSRSQPNSPRPRAVSEQFDAHESKAVDESSKGDSPGLGPPVAGNSLRRTMSNVGEMKKKKKSNRLIPGQWITDDDVYDEEDEPGWVQIVTSRNYIIG